MATPAAKPGLLLCARAVNHRVVGNLSFLRPTELNSGIWLKGQYGERATPSVKKIKSLMQRFKHEGFETPISQGETFWVKQILSKSVLGKWISEVVDDMDMRLENLLFGRAFTDEHEGIYQLRRLGSNPFVK